MEHVKPYFSVIIPTHNRPGMLQRALESVLQQTFSDYEIIVMNDGSSLSYDNVMAFAASYEHIIFLQQPRATGVSVARNTAAGYARGQWLIFLDDDDVYAPRCLEERYLNHCRNAVAETAFSWCNVKHIEVDDNGTEVGSYYSAFRHQYNNDGELFADAYKVGAGYALAVRTDVFRILEGFSARYQVGEDTDLILRLINHGYRPLINLGIGVVILHHEHEKLSKNMNNRSTLGVVELLFADHLPLLNRYLPLKMSYLIWSARTHFDAGNFVSGDSFFRMMVEVAMAEHHYIGWCKDTALYRKQLMEAAEQQTAGYPAPELSV